METEGRVKTDCFAYARCKCLALSEMVCKKKNCSFYKTKEQEEEDKRKYGYDTSKCKENSEV